MSASATTIVAPAAVARTTRTVSVFFAFGDRGLHPGHGHSGTGGRRAACLTAIANVNGSLQAQNEDHAVILKPGAAPTARKCMTGVILCAECAERTAHYPTAMRRSGSGPSVGWRCVRSGQCGNPVGEILPEVLDGQGFHCLASTVSLYVMVAVNP